MIEKGCFNPSIGIGGFQTWRHPLSGGTNDAKFQSLNRDRGLSNQVIPSMAVPSAKFQSLNRDRGLSNESSGQPATVLPQPFQSLNRDRGLSNSCAALMPWASSQFQSLNRDRGLSNILATGRATVWAAGFNPSIGIGGFQTASPEA